MNIYSYMFSLLFALLILIFAGCDGEPVFTEMSTNRLKIKIKGTLESEEPVIDEFDFTPGETSAALYADDSVNDHPVQPEDKMPTTFMLDIAEIKLNGKAIGKYRQVFSIPLSDHVPFFNGEGITLKNDDPGNGTYSTVQLYIRKMIFDNANIYTFEGSSWNPTPELARVIFKENEVEGFNFNNLQVNSYWDSLRDNASRVLRVYPLEIPIIGEMNYDRNDDETVLEIRIVIKNFIKMYEYDYYDDGIFKVCHFYGFSDWLRDVREDERNMGRNIIAVARAYVPDKAGTITGTGTNGHYVIALPYEYDDASEFRMPVVPNDDFRKDAVPNCDFPVAPVYSGSHIESVLDYFCNYEAYKFDWNTVAASCGDIANYEAEWDGYEALVENFKIAPHVTIVSEGSYTFENVMPGTYYIFTHADPGPTDPGPNKLFTGDWNSLGTATVP